MQFSLLVKIHTTYYLPKVNFILQMQQFPEDFNNESLNKLKDEAQEKLLCDIRQNMYDEIKANITKNIFTASFKLSDALNKDNKLKLCSELLQRFDMISLTISVDKNYFTSEIITFDVRKDLSEFYKVEAAMQKPLTVTINEITLHY